VPVRIARTLVAGATVFALEAAAVALLLVVSLLLVGGSLGAVGSPQGSSTNLALALLTFLGFTLPLAILMVQASALASRWFGSDRWATLLVVASLSGLAAYWFLSLVTFVNLWLWDVSLPLPGREIHFG
jgi:hypothetical protein